METVLEELCKCANGWLGYYWIAEMKSWLLSIGQWLRRRLRMCIWKRWKRVRTRFRKLPELGANRDQAWQWAITRKSCWRVFKSPILQRTLNNARMKRLGFRSLHDRYLSIWESKQVVCHRTAVCRTVRTVVLSRLRDKWCGRGVTPPSPIGI